MTESVNDNRLPLEQPVAIMVKTMIADHWNDDKKELAIQQAMLKGLCKLEEEVSLEVVK